MNVLGHLFVDGDESEEVERSAAVLSSGEGREGDDHLVVPMVVHGGEGGDGGAPASAHEVTDIVFHIHQNQMWQAIDAGRLEGSEEVHRGGEHGEGETMRIAEPRVTEGGASGSHPEEAVEIEEIVEGLFTTRCSLWRASRRLRMTSDVKP